MFFFEAGNVIEVQANTVPLAIVAASLIAKRSDD